MDIFKIFTDVLFVVGQGVSDNFISTIALAAGSGMVGVIAKLFFDYKKDFLKSEVKKIYKQIHDAIQKKVIVELDCSKYPFLKKLLYESYFFAEKYAISSDGEAKFKMAKDYILKKCPDLFDQYVDTILQTFYDEMKANCEEHQKENNK